MQRFFDAAFWKKFQNKNAEFALNLANNQAESRKHDEAQSEKPYEWEADLWTNL